MLFKIVHIHTSLLAVRFFLMGWATLSLIFIRKQPKENTVMPRSLRSFFRFVLAEFFFLRPCQGAVRRLRGRFLSQLSGIEIESE